MNPVCTYAGSLLTSCFHVLIMHKLMKAFFSRPSKNPMRFAAWTVYYILQVVPILGVTISPTAMLFLNMALVLMISSISYDAGMKRRCIFSALVCAVWMLMEITTDIILRLIGMDGWELQTAGTVISLMLMFLLAIIVGYYVKAYGPEGHLVLVCRRGPHCSRRKRLPDAQHLPDSGAA